MRGTRKLIAYFLLAFGISWIGVAAADTRERTFVAMLLGPPLAALLLILWFEKARGLRRLAQRLLTWPRNRAWYATLLVAPLMLVVIFAALALASPAFLPAIFVGEPVASRAAMALVVGLAAGFCEELGWTGYATPRLLRRWSWFGAGIALGVPWAIWHMFADYRGSALTGGLWLAHAAEWLVALVAFRVLMTWAFSRTRSLPLAMLLHATFTGSQVLLWPASPSPAVELIWYGTFAIELTLVVAFVRLAESVFASVAASKIERAMPLPGDGLVPEPMFSVTHAITIDKPPALVWPWLSQMGSSRAGWYSVDRIDNAGRPSEERIVPEYQHVAVGDVMPALPGASDAFVVDAVEPGRDLLLVVPGPHGPIVSWEHVLEPAGVGRTRLIVRGRASREWREMARGAGGSGHRRFIEYVYRMLARLPNAMMIAIARAGHRWMEARHLRGIKERAEALV